MVHVTLTTMLESVGPSLARGCYHVVMAGGPYYNFGFLLPTWRAQVMDLLTGVLYPVPGSVAGAAYGITVPCEFTAFTRMRSLDGVCE
jgi:hypothetical protein